LQATVKANAAIATFPKGKAKFRRSLAEKISTIFTKEVKFVLRASEVALRAVIKPP